MLMNEGSVLSTRGGGVKKILLVQPDYPIPPKRKINHDFLPIGLLKIGSYLKHCQGHEVKLILGNKVQNFYPDEIWITSLFTYWSKYVEDSVNYYRMHFPKARFIVGGIFASLMPEYCHKITGAEVHVGLFQPAEVWCAEHGVDYSLLEQPVDFQILHGMRGCFRRCKFCGTWKLEPEMTFDLDIAKKVRSRHVVFYDNNFLKNKHIKDILKELADVRIEGKRVIYESQSGFDGRILDQEIACLLHSARFINPRIAWDNKYEDWPEIETQVNMLKKAGYNSKEIYVFVLFNWDYPFETLEKKRLKCWEWGVQISDCRFRPLDQTFDRFNARLYQTSADYFIHTKWTDEEVKQFRKNVRRHNICVRHNFSFYSSELERMKKNKEEYMSYLSMPRAALKKDLVDIWFPDEFNGIKIKQAIIPYDVAADNTEWKQDDRHQEA